MPASGSRPNRHPDVTTAELIGGVEKRHLTIAGPDPEWPAKYAAHELRIRASLGPIAVVIQHIGSTAVPGLAAKPIIDILVTVHDITAEEDYLPQLTAAGYVLRVREPGHRMVRTPELDVHVHILPVSDPAAGEYLLLRDQLRRNDEDRELYERTKRELVEHDWADMNAYADAKTNVISRIKDRARADQGITRQRRARD